MFTKRSTRMSVILYPCEMSKPQTESIDTQKRRSPPGFLGSALLFWETFLHCICFVVVGLICGKDNTGRQQDISQQ